jgi:hypothetical protein
MAIKMCREALTGAAKFAIFRAAATDFLVFYHWDVSDPAGLLTRLLLSLADVHHRQDRLRDHFCDHIYCRPGVELLEGKIGDPHAFPEAVQDPDSHHTLYPAPIPDRKIRRIHLRAIRELL